MRRAARRLLAVVAAALLLAGAVGCGLGSGDAPSSVRLTVTDGFGRRPVVRSEAPEVRGEETVMRLLQRNAKVATRFGGGFVQSIEGLAGGEEDGRRVDWFYYVNGVEAGEGAAAMRVRPGDRIWWDRRAWSEAQRVPAVVGSFPEPFLHGVDGKRLPVRVECADPERPACRAVQRRLTDLGVVAAIGTLSASRSVETIRVVVGAWERVGLDAAVRLIARGPGQSGVFARFAAGGRRLQALDPDGRVARVAGAGSGLVAALRVEGEAPVWTVTGTDDAGVEAAARAFEEGALSDAYALAVVGDRGVELPVQERAR
jgi:hypothetical protein